MTSEARTRWQPFEPVPAVNGAVVPILATVDSLRRAWEEALESSTAEERADATCGRPRASRSGPQWSGWRPKSTPASLDIDSVTPAYTDQFADRHEEVEELLRKTLRAAVERFFGRLG